MLFQGAKHVSEARREEHIISLYGYGTVIRAFTIQSMDGESLFWIFRCGYPCHICSYAVKSFWTRGFLRSQQIASWKHFGATEQGLFFSCIWNPLYGIGGIRPIRSGDGLPLVYVYIVHGTYCVLEKCWGFGNSDRGKEWSGRPGD